MRILYPSNPFQRNEPEENYAPEHAAAGSGGFPISLFSFEEFLQGRFRPRPAFSPGESVCYRGWMLTLEDYKRLEEGIRDLGGHAFVGIREYELCHHLPAWYPLLKDHTPETICFGESDDVITALREAGWTRCFLKDYVKSLSTAGGSLVPLESIPEVISKMRKYRGMIEGGLCARRVEEFIPATETRHFVFRGVAHSPSGEVPDLVSLATKLIASPFFSVDTIQRQDGVLRIVELGDGQVSDLKDWNPEKFVKILATGTNP